MATIAQRLVAAGATPERARAFEQQFTQRVQGIQPGLGKPKDIQDAFDAEIAAFAAAKFPKTFRPPTIDDPRIDAYINFIYKNDNKTQELETKAWNVEAPNFSKVSRGLPANETKFNLDQYIVSGIQKGKAPAELLQDIIVNKFDLWDGLTEGKVSDIVNKYYGEYNKAVESIPTYKQNLLDTNKYYKYGLPDPNLQYGLKENLSDGIIDFRTHPSVERILQEEAKKTKSAIGYVPGYVTADVAERKAITQGAVDAAPKVLSALLGTKATPFVDEVKRRESLKKATTLGK